MACVKFRSFSFDMEIPVDFLPSQTTSSQGGSTALLRFLTLPSLDSDVSLWVEYSGCGCGNDSGEFERHSERKQAPGVHQSSVQGPLAAPFAIVC